MRRLIPQPWTSAVLLIVWLLLFNAVTPGLLLLGGLLAVALPLFTHRFWPEYPQTIRIRPLLGLIGVVLFDIAIANVKLVPRLLGPRDRLRPHFISIPVELRQPFPITLLASIISLTPGTVSANLSGDRRTLLVHDIDVEDEAEAVARIKARYERPLLEIFE